MPLPTPLRTALFNSGKSQIAIAKKAGIHESRLSKLAHGHVEPTDDEVASLVKVLGVPDNQLFPKRALA